MGFITDDVKQRLTVLIEQGHNLYYSLGYSTTAKERQKEQEERFKESGIKVAKLPDFITSYEVWYSEALQYVKKLMPDRTSDFTSLYKNDKRKEITSSTYTISDAIIGTTITRGDTIRANPRSAVPKMLQQVSILESAQGLVDSVIYTISFSIRADLFDSELDAAGELLKAGFMRACGAMCGVVLEKHLAQVCTQHGISLKKKSPTINDYNEELKNASVIDLPTWRRIQLLGDLRNLCCHDKSVEPTKEQASDLLTGTVKISKTVY
jgi:hypothetical protein